MTEKKEDGKLAAAKAAAALVQDGMRVGLGTGSTAAHFIRLLGERVRQGLRITAVATSERSEALARSVSVPILPFEEAGELDLTVDGADEADPALNLIKGGGGALLREKIVAYHSKRMIVIADDAKLVPMLGAFPLPVEIVRFWRQATERAILRLACSPRLRMNGSEPFLTDNGNYILDCPFDRIPDPAALERQLNTIPGVVEAGLFVGMAERALFGGPDGVRELVRK